MEGIICCEFQFFWVEAKASQCFQNWHDNGGLICTISKTILAKHKTWFSHTQNFPKNVVDVAFHLSIFFVMTSTNWSKIIRLCFSKHWITFSPFFLSLFAFKKNKIFVYLTDNTTKILHVCHNCIGSKGLYNYIKTKKIVFKTKVIISNHN